MAQTPAPEPTFFASPAEFRRWLERHHQTATELWVGFHKKATGKPSLTWPESVREALCFGWIDAVRKRIDDEAYAIRFTRRKPTSIWSAVNVRTMEELIAAGLVREAGLAAYAHRTDARTAVYSFERAEAPELTAAETARFRRNRAAWRFFEAQPAGYRRTATHWVVSAKRDDTRERRLTTLIDDSAAGRRLAHLTRR